MYDAPEAYDQTAHQSEDFKEVQVGVEDVLDLLQPLLAQGAHGVANPVEAHAAGEDDEALEQGLAAGDVFELQVRDAVGKLSTRTKKEKKGWKAEITVERVSKNQNVSWLGPQ